MGEAILMNPPRQGNSNESLSCFCGETCGGYSLESPRWGDSNEYIHFFLWRKKQKRKINPKSHHQIPKFITVSLEDCYICNYTKPVSYALVICNHSPSSMGEGRHSGGKCDHFYLCVAPAVPRGGG